MATKVVVQTLIIAASVAAVVAALLLDDIAQQASSKAQPNQELAELYLVDTQIIQFDQQGDPQQIINSPMSVQAGKQKQASILKPTLLLYKNGDLQWTINAENGLISKQTAEISLQNNVKLVDANSRSILRTEELNFNTEKQIAFSDSRIDVQSDQANITANQLEFNLNEGQYKLSKRVIANYANQP